MKGFRAVTPEIPSHVWIREISLRIFLLAVNKIREFDWVFNKKDWGIVANHVKVAIFSVKFQGKPSRISHYIRRSLLSSNC
jgi:hypothetical protein